MSNKKTIMLSALSILAGTAAFGEVTTGWIQSVAGTYDYADAANWANGEVNGIFSEDLGLEGDVVVRFTDDTTIAGLKVACVGNGKKLSFICDNKRTITCTGDLLVESVDLGSVEFGSSTAAQNFTLDMNGREMTLSAASKVQLYAKLSNGGVIFENEQELSLYGENAHEGGTWLRGTGWVCFGHDAAFGPTASTIYLGEGSRLYSNLKNGYRKVKNKNKLVIEGNCTLGKTDKDIGGVYFTDCPIELEKPVTITLNRYNFKFNGGFVGSYGWKDISFRVDFGPDNKLYPGIIVETPLNLSEGEVFNLRMINVTLAGPETGSGKVIVSDGATFTLSGAATAPNLDVEVVGGSKVSLQTSVGGTITPVKSLKMCGGNLEVKGVKSADTEFQIANLVLDSESGNPNVTVTTDGSAVTGLKIGQLTKVKPVVLNLNDADFGGAVRMSIQDATAESLVPWVRFGGQYLACYDAERGFMKADPVSFDSYSGSEKFTPEADTDVNALAFSGTAGLGASDFTVTVASGAIAFFASGNTGNDSAVAFGEQTGYITFREGFQQWWSKDISGLNGLVLSGLGAGVPSSKDNKGFVLNHATTYTGDTYINGVVYPYVNGCLPYGKDRPGNIYLNGSLNLGKQGNFALHLNGLYGSGIIEKDNYSTTIYVGEDGSDGVFDGSINGNKLFGFQKNGVGKQVMNGGISQQYTVAVNDGELELNGSVLVSNSGNFILASKTGQSEVGGTLSGAGDLDAPGGVKIQNGATFAPGSALKPGKAMTLTERTPLVFETGSKLKVHIGADYMSQVVSAGDIKGAVTVPVVLENTYPKSCKVTLLEAKSIEPTFVLEKSTGTPGSLSIEQDEDAGLVRLCYTRTQGLMVIIK